MIITLKLSPQIPCGELAPLVIERRGQALVLDGEVLDLSFMSPGDSLPVGAIDHPLLTSATIARGDIDLLIDGLLFHIAADQTDPAACFPEPVIITQDGLVALPAQAPPPPPPVLEPEPEPVETSTVEPEDEY